MQCERSHCAHHQQLAEGARGECRHQAVVVLLKILFIINPNTLKVTYYTTRCECEQLSQATLKIKWACPPIYNPYSTSKWTRPPVKSEEADFQNMSSPTLACVIVYRKKSSRARCTAAAVTVVAARAELSSAVHRGCRAQVAILYSIPVPAGSVHGG